jgi:3-hydroxybutyryl-CoA dehydrogenase
MGPFELMDTTGLDVSGVVMESIYEQFYQEQRFKPQAFIRNRMAAGLHGRKVGKGFYDLRRQQEGRTGCACRADRPAGQAVWIGPAGHDSTQVLADFLKGKVEIETGAKPSARAICMVAPMGRDATMTAIDLGIEAERTVAVDTLFGLDGRRTMMTTSVTDEGVRDLAHGVLASDGGAVTVIHDSPGFIAQRVIATIVNISSEIAQMRIATPEDINKAVQSRSRLSAGPAGIRRQPGRGENSRHPDGNARFLWRSALPPEPVAHPPRARLGISLMTPEAVGFPLQW